MPAADVAKIARAAGAARLGLTLRAFGYQSTLWLGRLRLHVFHRGDPGVAMHDHPWPFWTFPLTPYVEEILDGDKVRRQVVRAARVTYRPSSHTHRILGRWQGAGNWAGTPDVRPGAVVTICVRGRSHGAEAFNYVAVLAGKIHRIPWRRYLERADQRPTKHLRSSSS